MVDGVGRGGGNSERGLKWGGSGVGSSRTLSKTCHRGYGKSKNCS